MDLWMKDPVLSKLKTFEVLSAVKLSAADYVWVQWKGRRIYTIVAQLAGRMWLAKTKWYMTRK
jgi:hypothetical protein